MVQFALAVAVSPIEVGHSGDKLSMGVNQSTSRLGHLQMEAALRLLSSVTEALRGVRVYPFHHDHAISQAPHQSGQSGGRVECPSSGVHFDGCIFGETNDTPTVFNRGSQSITVNLTQTFHLDNPILCGDLGVVALPGLHSGLQNVLNKTMGNPGNGDGHGGHNGQTGGNDRDTGSDNGDNGRDGNGGGRVNSSNGALPHNPDDPVVRPHDKKRHIESECEDREHPTKRRPTHEAERTHGPHNDMVEQVEPEESLFSDSDTVEMMGNEPTPPSSSSIVQFSTVALTTRSVNMCGEGDLDARRASC